jgi:hypothetical protein
LVNTDDKVLKAGLLEAAVGFVAASAKYERSACLRPGVTN